MTSLSDFDVVRNATVIPVVLSPLRDDEERSLCKASGLLFSAFPNVIDLRGRQYRRRSCYTWPRSSCILRRDQLNISAAGGGIGLGLGHLGRKLAVARLNHERTCSHIVISCDRKCDVAKAFWHGRGFVA